MASEKSKMISGQIYYSNDPELVQEREVVHYECHLFNSTHGCGETKFERLQAHFASCGNGCYIEPPFYLDYGYNLHLGDNVYFNINCTILDCAKVTIGDRVKFGPGVQVYTAGHVLDPVRRGAGDEFAKEIHIAADVWVGGGSIILPGVNIGYGSVIGAGSVVSRDIPDKVVAVGNPCSVIRPIA